MRPLRVLFDIETQSLLAAKVNTWIVNLSPAHFVSSISPEGSEAFHGCDL